MLKENKEQIKKFINYLSAKNLGEKSIKLYKFHLNSFFEQKILWNKTKMEDITNFINKKDEEIQKQSINWEIPRKKLSKTTKNNIYTILKRFFKFSGKHKLAEKISEDLRIKGTRKDSKKPVHLEEEEIIAMSKAHIAGSSELNIRNNLILYFFVSTGVRTFELTKLTKSDLKLNEPLKDKDNRLVSLIGKGRVERKILVPGWWINLYKKNYRSGCNYLFCSKKTETKLTEHSIWFIIKEKAKQANVEKKVQGIARHGSFISPHKLRSTWITNLHINKENLLVIQELAGHDSPETTKRYTQMTDGELKKAYSPKPKKVVL